MQVCLGSHFQMKFAKNKNPMEIKLFMSLAEMTGTRQAWRLGWPCFTIWATVTHGLKLVVISILQIYQT